MTRPFDFSQAAATGITILPDLPPLPNVGDALVVAAITDGRAQLSFQPVSGGGTGVFLPISGGTLTGPLTLAGDPTAALHAAPRQYVDAVIPSILGTVNATYLPLAGGVMTGFLTLPAITPTLPGHATAKSYVDTAVAAAGIGTFLPLTGGAVSGNLSVLGTLSSAGTVSGSGFTTLLAPYALSSSIPAARNAARLQAQWQGAATVEDDTVWWWDMPYDGTISTLKFFTGAGSFTVAIKINGVTVTGLSAVAVSSSTPATATATAANTFAKGDNIMAVITGATGSPTDALLSLAVTWS